MTPTEPARLSRPRLQRLESRIAPALSSWLAGPISPTINDFFLVDNFDRVAVRITATNITALLPNLVNNFGFIGTTQPAQHFAEGYVSISKLTALPGLSADGLLGVIPVFRGRTSGGSGDPPVISEADLVLEAARLRDQPPGSAFDGTGVTIGIISDSMNRRPDLTTSFANDQLTGEIPADVLILSDGPVFNNDKLNPNVTDEGRAMLQVAYDLARNSKYAFTSGVLGETAFVNRLFDLVDNAKAKVVVDDVYFVTEPFFQDGVISQAIASVVANQGVAYLSAAGNFGRQSYEALDFNGIQDSQFGPEFLFHDFNPDPLTQDARQTITLAPNQRVTLSLQWDDPFYTTDGVKTDLDVLLVAPGTTITLAGSFGGVDDNLASQIPLEVLDYTNKTGSAQTVELLIRLKAGEVPQRFKYVNYAAGISGGASFEYVTESPTIVPHAAAPGAYGVAAVPFFNQLELQSYSSSGPLTILFTPDGKALPDSVIRPGVKFTSIDGVNNTFFGQNIAIDGTTTPNFFGTSAAAAHAAAAAAMVWQAFPDDSPTQLFDRLSKTARDLGPPGFDFGSGAGLISAYRAVNPLPVSAFAPAAFTFDSFAPGPNFGILTGGNSRLRATNQFGPIGARHVVLDNFFPDPMRPSLTELVLQVQALTVGPFTLSFSARGYNEAADLMPPVFTGSINADGVAFSVDGTTWHRLVSLTGTNIGNSYQGFVFDLAQEAAAVGVSLNSTTLVKFQRYGAGTAESNTGGIAFDQIVVGAAVTTTTVFTGNAGTGSWFNELNWSKNVVPGPSDNVVIDFPGGAVVIDLPQTAAAKTLVAGSAVRILGGNLQVGETAQFNGPLELAAGELGGPAKVTINGGLQWTGGKIGPGGDLIIPAGKSASLAGGVLQYDNRPVQQFGTVTWVGGDIFTNGGTWTVEGTGTFVIDQTAPTQWAFDAKSGATPATMQIKPGATFRRQGPGQTTFFGPFQMTGGLLGVVNGRLLAAGGGSFSGPIAITDGALELTGGDFVLNSPTVGGGGRIRLDGGAGVLPSGAAAEFKNFTFASGAIAGPGTFRVSGEMLWNAGKMSDGVLQLATGSKLDFKGPAPKLLSNQIVSNGGQVFVTEGQLTSGGGAWVNRPGGSLVWQSGQSWSFDQLLGLTPTPVIVEAGSSYFHVGDDSLGSGPTLAGPLTVAGDFVLESRLKLLGGLTNFAGQKLSGGKFVLVGPLTIPDPPGVPIEVNDAQLVLIGDSADIVDSAQQSRLEGLKLNNDKALLELVADRELELTGGLTNAGTLLLQPDSSLKLGPGGKYIQTGGRTEVSGNLIAPGGFDSKGGSVGGKGGRFTGNFLNRGLLRPGSSPGDMKLEGDFDQDSGGTLEIEIIGTDPGEHDELIVIGDVNLDGNLVVVALSPTLPIDNVWRVIDNRGSNPVTGNFIGLPQGKIFRANDGQAFQISYQGGTGNDVTLTRVPAPAKSAPTVADGLEQRSRINQIVVPFDAKVTLPADPVTAFQLVRTGPSGPTGPVTLTAKFNPAAAPSTVTLTFGGSLTESGSLIDGNYQLTIFAAKVLSDGLPLDGNGDGVGGDDFNLTLHRFFGDGNGDRKVNFVDYLSFRGTFGLSQSDPGYLPYMDFDDNGTVNFNDFLPFRNRFGQTIDP